MSSNVNIPSQSSITAPTPQNTPLTNAPISHQLSRPTVPDIQEGEDEDDGEESPASPGPGNHVGRAGGKLSSLIGKSSGYIENLPVEIKRNVEALKGVQVQFTKLQKQHKMEVHELERKYLALYSPLFARRHDIISGTAAPTRAEIVAGEAQSLEDDPDYVALPPSSPPFTPISPVSSTAGIPQFWLTALRNHVGLSDLITDRDAEALKSLTDVRVTYLEGNDAGFKLTFVFEENEFFSDNELTKTYVYRDELGYEGDFVFEKAIGCDIKWKEDKDLTKSFEIKKQRNKNTNRTRLIRKAHPTESFFNFFTPPMPPDEDAVENGEVDEEELEDIEERLELDFQIGEDFKERIIPRAVDYFTGKALEYEDMGMDDEDEIDEFDEDDEDEEDAEEDSDEEGYEARKPPRRTAGKRGAGNVDPSKDCPQQ